MVLCERLFKDEWILRACGSLEAFQKGVVRYQRSRREKALSEGKKLYSQAPAEYLSDCGSAGNSFAKRVDRLSAMAWLDRIAPCAAAGPGIAVCVEQDGASTQQRNG